MEKKWLISVEEGTLDKVSENLRKKEATILQVLDAIGIIIIDPGKLKMKDIKNIEGVLSVEEERDNSI